MKVSIYVWTPEIEHEALEGTPRDILVDSYEMDNPSIIAYGDIMIERAHTFSDCMSVSLNNYPARIDIDTYYHDIHLLNEVGANNYPDGYSYLKSSEVSILWTNPNFKKAEVS